MLNDTDLLLVHRGGVDYKVTAAELKDYFNKPTMPWESKDSWIHYKIEGSSYCYNHEGIYLLDGTLIHEADSYTNIDEPEFVVAGNKATVGAYSRAAQVGPISNLGTRTDMSSMFDGLEGLTALEFGPDWDTTNVTNMAQMFAYNVGAFTADFSSWNTSNVTDMSSMFRRGDSMVCKMTGLSSWDTSKVTNMRNMFGYIDFNEDISGWNTSNVTNMADMFEGARFFNQNISGWDVSNVTDMNSMFHGNRAFNQNIGGWNVSNVTNMGYMFSSTEAFDQNIGGWDVSNVTDMGYMFNSYSDTVIFNQDLSGWCVTKITSEPSRFRAGSLMPSDGSYDPKWGTCP